MLHLALRVFAWPRHSASRPHSNRPQGAHPFSPRTIEGNWTMIKNAIIAASLCATVGLSGCTSTGTLTPTVQADINVAYANVCAALPAFGPISATMNANAQNAYAQAETICAAGS